MREFAYLVAGLTAAVAVGVAVLCAVLGVSLWIAGIVFVALAVFLFFWDFERDEVFKDDWIEIGQATASIISGVAGLALLAAHLLA